MSNQRPPPGPPTPAPRTADKRQHRVQTGGPQYFDKMHVDKVFRALEERDEIRHSCHLRELQNQRKSNPVGRATELGLQIAGALVKRGGSRGSREKEESAEAREKERREYYNKMTGIQRENANCNRYPDVIPYDRTRVQIVPSVIFGHSAQEGDYLNASWVREKWGGQWYIAAQAPLPDTFHSFLSLFFSTGARPPRDIAPELYKGNNRRMRTIVQLTRAMEGGWVKAHPYFHASQVRKPFIVHPPPGSKAPPLEVQLEREKNIPDARCVKSVLRVVACHVSMKKYGAEMVYEKDKEIGNPVYINHFVFNAWPDHGVPQQSDRNALMKFARTVAEANTNPAHSSIIRPGEKRGGSPPIMVHCSAGVGRTGTFIALCSIMRSNGLLHPPPLSQPVGSSFNRAPEIGPLADWLSSDPIAHEVDMLREQRLMMVQTPDQLMLLYDIYHMLESRKGNSGGRGREKV